MATMRGKSPWWRRIAIGAVVAVLLGLGIVAVAFWALRAPRAQRAVIERLSGWTTTELGFAVEAAGFRLAPLSGTLEIDELRLRLPGEPPFAGARRLSARWAPGAIFRRPLRLASLELDRPTVDLGAPLPGDGTDSEPAPSLESLPLVVERLAAAGGSISGGAAGEQVTAWRIDQIALDAGFDGHRLDVGRLAAAAEIELAGREGGPLALELLVSGSAGLAGELDIEALKVTGEALEAELSGRFDAARGAPAGSFTVAADPGFWLGGEPTGPVRLEGVVDLAAWQGTVTVAGGRQPARLLGGLMPPEQAAALELEASSVEVQADLSLVETRSLTGTVRFDLYRDGTRVLDLVARPRLELAGELPLTIAAEARILPDDPGARRLEARLDSPAARRLADWRIDGGLASIDQPAAEALARRLAGLYPRLLDPASLSQLPPLGRLAAQARFQGPLSDPEIAADAVLQPQPGARITATLSGRAVAGPLTLETTGSGLELAGFAPGVAGRAEWSGRVTDLLGEATGRLDLSLADLATEAGPIAESVTAELSGGRRQMDWRVAADHPGGASGIASGTVDPRLPLDRATAEWRVETADPRLPRVEGSLELAGGALAGRVEAVVAGRPPVELDLRVPLAALDALPQLATLATLPVVRGDGPIEIAWSAPEGDWSQFVAQIAEGRIGSLEGGTTGRLSLEPDCAECSTGSAEVSGFAVELDGRRAAAVEPLRLALAGGRLQVAPWALAGDGFELAAEGQLALSPSWQEAGAPADLLADLTAVLTASIDSSWLASLPIEILTPGRLSLRAEISGPPAGLRGTAEVAAPGLSVAAAAYPTLALAEPAARLSLADGLLAWEGARLEVGDAVLTSSGGTRIAAPLEETTGRLEIVSGLPVVGALRLPFTLRDGLLEVADGAVETTGGAGSLRLAVPLEGPLDGPLDGPLEGRAAESLARVAWELPANDWAPLLAALGAGQEAGVLEMATRGSLTLSPDRPALAEGSVVLDAARLMVRGRETRIEPAIELWVAGGELRIAPFVLRSGAETFAFEARASLEPGWRPSDPPAGLVTGFDLQGSGQIDAGLLNPLLVGGRAEGSLGLEIAVSGSPADWSGQILVDGPEAAVLFRSPYLTRFQRPRLRLALQDGAVTIEEGSALLNEGALDLSGLAWEDGRGDLTFRVSEALFRLDYGLLATLAADLRWRFEADGSSRLSGTLDLDRGTLTRNVRLDLDLLSQFLAPIDLTTTEDDPLELIELDLAVRTREGVRVKNNLGDLLVRWEPLVVTGTLARPIIEGRLETDPGGLLRLYGQTVRLDKAALDYPGQEGVEPQLDLEVTTSFEDPSLGNLNFDDPFRAESTAAAAPAASAAAADLARYLGDQFAGKVGESAGFTVSLRPLLIFGETDPGAQLTVGRDLSPYVSIAAAIDLRTTQGRTYLLELHELPWLPRFVAQGYTNDQSAYGGALLFRQEFGGSVEASKKELPRISKIVMDPPPGVSRRGVRRALGLEKGGGFDTSERFAAEVELLDYLLFKGYPDARVTVRPTPAGSGGRKVELAVAIEPGPRVQFVFEGDKIPKPLRPLITAIYRPDFFEAESIVDLQAETVRALRSRGFLDPQVEVRVEPLDPEQPAGARQVVIRSDGGLKISPEPPVFLGVPPEDAAELTALFVNAVQRIELAVGLPSADRRLLSALAGLGYPEARIASRYESLSDRALVVEIEPGPRQRIASVAIDSAAGAADVSGEGLDPLLAVAAGDPLRRGRLARSALSIQRELNARGRLEANVQTQLEPADSADPYSFTVRFVVDPGEVSRLADIELRGLRSTRKRWARRVADLDTGQVLARGDLAKARTNLWRTGLFRGVATETLDVEPGQKRVIFDLTESARFRLSYGVRWDSDEGPGAVFDATDQNFLGRNLTLGMRALYTSDQSSLRGLLRIPRVFGGPGTVELFAAARKVAETTVDPIFGPTALDAQIREATLQYSHPLGKRTTLRVYGRYTYSKRPLPAFTLRVRDPQLGFQYVFDSRSQEDPLDDRGILASTDLSGSGQYLGGDLRYVRMLSQFNLYRPIGRLMGRRLSWLQSFRLGLSDSFDQQLTPENRFFTGGEYSVRGYATSALGDRETFGLMEPIGGAALLVFNQELHWRLFDDYALVVFADAGNVWQDTADLGSDLRTSAGLGIRAVTAIGLLRLDFAQPLDRRPEIDPKFKIYFGLGNAF